MIVFIFGAIAAAVKAVTDFISNNSEIFTVIVFLFAVIMVVIAIVNAIIKKHRRVLRKEILEYLHLENIDELLPDYDDTVIVKSRQTLNNYSDLKYLKDTNYFDYVWKTSERRKQIKSAIASFLKVNDFQSRPQYSFVEKQLSEYALLAN